ncbi:unnamed protein product [Rotaria sp. Silwood1]|nr:unnamed protein product [Rotaria sp. Silwood1]CAF1658263.1 unnamed protein product [Rotaria sp. Silwood1]CAF3890058.1 unnamed protein product [Rotaria sp. Silwood1]CAF3915395.1 unnamed protein product [Rotaria sp. Silwood1]CAF4004693.1 unnamed protein product [Rotaria sp. Silwood1]
MQSSLQNTTTDAIYYLDDLLVNDADSTPYDLGRTHAVATVAVRAYHAARNHLDEDAARDAARCAGLAALTSYNSDAAVRTAARDAFRRDALAGVDSYDAAISHVKAFIAGNGLTPDRAALRAARIRALAASVVLTRFGPHHSDAAIGPTLDNAIRNDSVLSDASAALLRIGRECFAGIDGATNPVGPADRDGYDEDWI